eukprot:g13808.t1
MLHHCCETRERINERPAVDSDNLKAQFAEEWHRIQAGFTAAHREHLLATNELINKMLRQGAGIRWLSYAELVFSGFYVVEFLLKLLVHRLFYFWCPEWRWNVFDALLATLSAVSRILRGLRVISFVRQLRIMVSSIVGSAMALFWSLLVLLIVEVVFSILFVQLVTNFLADVETGSTPAAERLEAWFPSREDAQDLRQICNRIDCDGNGRIAWPEFEAYMQHNNDGFARLKACGLDVHDVHEFFVSLTSGQPAETVEIEDFIHHAMRLRGTATSIQVKSIASQMMRVQSEAQEAMMWKADGSPAVSKVLHVVASLALPDAAHREKEGQTSSVFFLVPCGNGQLLHGVSCHRRVEAAELLHRDASVSREDSSFSVDFLCKEIKELTRCTSAEKAWLLEASQRLEKAMPKEHAQASRPAVRPQDQDNDDDDELELVADAPHLSDDAVKRFDSEELVRDAQAHLASPCGDEMCASADAIAEVNTAALRQEHLLQETTWAATVDADRNAFAGYWIRLVVALAKTSGPERDFAAGLEVASRQEKSDLARFGLPFLQRWVMRTHGGQLWLQVHKLPVKERRPKPPREGQGTYRFSNGDEYRGEFRRGMRHGSGVYISQRNRMQYDGQWFRDRRHGNGTLTIEAAGKVLYTYDGQWQADPCLQQ